MKKQVFILLIFLLTINLSFGQTNQTKKTESKRSITGVSLIDNPGTLESSSKPAIESAYFGFDNKIKDITVSGTIPNSLPTKEGFTDREIYRVAINKWIKENPSFIKPEFKETSITK